MSSYSFLDPNSQTPKHLQEAHVGQKLTELHFFSQTNFNRPIIKTAVHRVHAVHAANACITTGE